MTGVITRATPVPAPGMPGRVRIYEVGPRDGLQNEQEIVPLEVKEEFVRRLLAAGLPVVEATSFVHPRWVPQLADAADLMTALGDSIGEAARDCPVLVPNERGLDRALELGLRHVAVFASATETFAAKNLNRTLDSQLHDTYGQALSNVQAGLRAGVTTYDASAGGLGGCPYAQSATGNLATEDLVWLLDGLGIDHGVDLEALVATSAWMAQQLGRPSPSAVVRALAQSTS